MATFAASCSASQCRLAWKSRRALQCTPSPSSYSFAASLTATRPSYRREPSASICRESIERDARPTDSSPRLRSWRHDSSEARGGIARTISFRDFARLVEQAAGRLSSTCAAAAAAGGTVAILSLPSVPFFVYTLAVIRGGGAAAVLNWRQPHDALVAMARAASARSLLASVDLGNEARRLCDSAAGVRLLWIPRSCADDAPAPTPDDPSRPHSAAADATSAQPPAEVRAGGGDAGTDEAGFAREAAQREGELAGADSSPGNATALLLFTSGSTGAPKPVALSHCALLAACGAKRRMSAELLSTQRAGTLSFLPNFHVIGLVNNFLFNLSAAIRCAVLEDAAAAGARTRRLSHTRTITGTNTTRTPHAWTHAAASPVHTRNAPSTRPPSDTSHRHVPPTRPTDTSHRHVPRRPAHGSDAAARVRGLRA